MNYPKFDGLAVSSKFAICGLPIRLDAYRTCTFGCQYCFSNGRKVMEFDKSQAAVCNVASVEKRLERVMNGCFDESNFLDSLISQGITWHCGGMSDPFQPLEAELGITHDLIDVTMKHGVSILFSTKSDTVYNANINPLFHTFQLSVINTDNRKDIEPNVPDIASRIDFYRRLKAEGFKVGIRIQPFIPGVTTLDVVKAFPDADHFTIEGIKIVPQNEEQKDFILTELSKTFKNFDPRVAFTQMGLLNMKPELRYELYKPFVEYFKEHGISFSIADNDMRWLGNNNCCCGDRLVGSATSFNVTNMIRKYGRRYTLEQMQKEIGCFADCKCSDLFTSNRTQGCKTVGEFYRKRFRQDNSPFSPRFQWIWQPSLF